MRFVILASLRSEPDSIQPIKKYCQMGQMFVLSHITMALNQGQGHTGQYQNIDFLLVSIIRPSSHQISL